jgi:hypothetical protein
MTGETFSVSVRPSRRGGERDLLGDQRVSICIDPGDQTMGFPVLHVAGWVKDPEIFAAKVARLLTEGSI